ncbi:IPT/TIG domain-containing protein [Streptomyces sp. PTD5-9]|uniref:IPT/TIG domain-containing protein n=1 Tax=Streptomyces sp. PTD5-9 TaxID=3120150 RepID=UPI00300B25DB
MRPLPRTLGNVNNCVLPQASPGVVDNRPFPTEAEQLGRARSTGPPRENKERCTYPSPSQGSTGGRTLVAITGTDLPHTTKVIFGGKPATSITQVSRPRDSRTTRSSHRKARLRTAHRNGDGTRKFLKELAWRRNP